MTSNPPANGTPNRSSTGQADTVARLTNQPTTGSPSKSAALSFAARGYAVFPCDPTSKAPLYRRGAHPTWAPDPDGPAGLSRATVDPDIIGQHWPTHAAVGVIPPVGVAFIDADEKHKPGIVSELLDRWPALAIGGHHITRSVGAHFAGRIPPDLELPQSVDRNLGVDTRSNAAGYVLAPPAPGYRIVRPFMHVSRLPLLPIDFIEWLNPTPAARATRPSPAPENGERLARYVAAAVEGEYLAVADTPPGGRNHRLHIAAVKLGSLVGARVLEEADARDALLAAASACGLSTSEAQRTITSGLAFGIAHPREIEATR